MNRYLAREDYGAINYTLVYTLYILTSLGWLGSQEGLWRTSVYVQIVVEPVTVDKLSARYLIIIFNHMSNFRLIIHSCWKQSQNDVHFQENT